MYIEIKMCVVDLVGYMDKAKKVRDSRDGDGPVAEILPVHGLDRRVRRLERRVVDEGEALEDCKTSLIIIILDSN